MPGLNKAQIIGKIINPITLNKTNSGRYVVNLLLETSDVWFDTNRKKCEKKETHSVVIFGKTAKSLCKNKKQYDVIYVEGKLRVKKETQITEIVIDGNNGNVDFINQ